MMEKCIVQAGDGSYNNGYPDATWFCLVMNNCGFPLNAYMANTMYCPLHMNGTSVVPTRQVDAMCFNNAANLGQDCSVNDQLNSNSAINYMNNQLTNQQNSDWEPVLSLLFNAFIWCQVFNEICSRRINDEYDFFISGLHKSPIFLAVLLITIGLQALIINFMGIFFTVVPLSWQEWLVCIAVGFGSCVVSWITRFISRNMACSSRDILLLRKDRQTLLGRTLSGRSMSGRVADERTLTGRSNGGDKANSGRPGSANKGPRSPTSSFKV
ncbi:hypothetical protein CEUSTIGMA_g6137.t1 [Chlamydomonas eustigma]|uniref:Cation-transporting P-type ATPase C-terminal domain-containing protein n=1 Tax=Chlamydomonas eustigma TaxID=1157962 RepID=A0A250X709_9CHLO|nr:hypothetical protein CEUSTIGMA_g6137.t1 [Chlamydomonas eustigma]|eukprot:GAX78699.1 hypothetical protein CEUSTIGMA_g6137.t1 [Chlamydomonas eustigma]